MGLFVVVSDVLVNMVYLNGLPWMSRAYVWYIYPFAALLWSRSKPAIPYELF